MKHIANRVLALLLAAVLICAAAGPIPGAAADSADLLSVTTGTYTCTNPAIQQGELYTLIALKRGAVPAGEPLTVALLLTLSPLYVGNAVAQAAGSVTFDAVRLRTADAVEYFVAGPGLDAPLRESTSLTTALSGSIITASSDRSATVTLVDKDTGYSYANAVTTDPSGNYSFDSISPGSYVIWVHKPGYLPFTDGETVTVSNTSISDRILRIASWVGDVNNDGRRDNADLADLLLYWDMTSGWPLRLTPDLDASGTVDAGDLALLVGKAGVVTGDSDPAQPPLLTVTDSPVSGALRKLSFTVSGGATFSAGAFTLTCHRDAVQPCTPGGGSCTPAAGAPASCLMVPAQGVALASSSWSVEEDSLSLTFTLTASALSTGSELTVAEFYYKPTGGTADSLFSGAFRLPVARVLTGKRTVVGCSQLTYPNSAALPLTAISIDQADGGALPIPGNGQTTVLPLTVTGKDASDNTYENLSGVTWTLADGSGTSPGGVSVSQGLLTVTPRAQAGPVTVTAAWPAEGGAPLTHAIGLTLTSETSAAARLELQHAEGGDPLPFTRLEARTTTAAVLPLTLPITAARGYSARLLDQYGAEMTPPALTDLTWTLSAAPVGVTFEGGVLTVPTGLPAGDYAFSLQAASGELQASVAVALTVEPVLAALTVSGPDSAAVPSASGALTTLDYTLQGWDANGDPMALVAPLFSISPLVESPSASVDLNGCCVTVSSAAQPGHYTLTASQDGVSVDFPLELLPAAANDAAYLAIYSGGAPVTVADLTAHAGSDLLASFSAKALNVQGRAAAAQPATLRWLLQDAPAGVEVSDSGGLTVPRTLAAGSYSFSLTAADLTSGLSATAKVRLTVEPVLAALELAGPAGSALTVPTGDSLAFTVSLVAARDSQGAPIMPPAGLTWSVARPDGGDLTGVAIHPDTGLLSLQPGARSGALRVTASSGAVTGTLDLALNAPASACILKLYRDGTPVSGGVDRVNVKEGSGAVELAYTAQVLDGDGVPVADQTVTWFHRVTSLSVDADAAPGLYEADLTAIWGTQGASVTPQVKVYPHIVDLDIDWGGQTLQIPQKTLSPTYRGTVIAITAKGERIPLSQLEDYTLQVSTPMAGVYPRYDTDSHTLLLTLDSSAAAAYRDTAVTKALGLVLSYFPGETMAGKRIPLTLNMEPSFATAATLHLGTGTGSVFYFSTPGSDTHTTAAGTLSNCYALQLRDQYGHPLATDSSGLLVDRYGTPVTTDQKGDPLPAAQRKVAWTLTGDVPRGVALVSYSYADSYPKYASIRQLQVGSAVAPGTYSMTLTASAAGFTCRMPITLTVADLAAASSMTLTGPDALTIPKWYETYGSSALYNRERTAAYKVLLLNDQGQELIADERVAWSLVDVNGKTISPAGVTLLGSGSSATLSVSRTAQPTGSSPICVRAYDTGSGLEERCEVILSRGQSIPTLLILLDKSGQPITADSILSKADTAQTRTYTPRLLDQYNQPLSLSDYPITWSTGVLPTGVSFDPRTHTLTVSSTVTKGGTFTLTASRTAPEGYSQPLKASVTVTLSVSSSPGPGPGPSPGPSPDPGPSKPGPSGPSSPDPEDPKDPGDPKDPENPDGPKDPESPDTPEVVLPVVDPDNRVLYPPVTAAEDGRNLVTLTPQEEEAILSFSSNGPVTLIPVQETPASDLSDLTLTLSAATAAQLAEQGRGLRLQTSLGTVYLDSDALRSLAEQGGDRAAISLLREGHDFILAFPAEPDSITALSGRVILSAYDPTLSGTGNVVCLVEGEEETILPKGLVESTRVLVELTGPGRIRVKYTALTFEDVLPTYWAGDYISFVTARRLFLGTSGTQFSPTDPMTRSMVVTVLHRLERTPAAPQDSDFADVPSGTWFTEGVSWATSHNIVQGYNGYFSPDVPVSREQLATILFRYAQWLELSTDSRATLGAFPDGEDTSPWAREAMEWAVSVKLINGKGDGSLDPQGNASRAEVATILERLIRLMAPAV